MPVARFHRPPAPLAVGGRWARRRLRHEAPEWYLRGFLNRPRENGPFGVLDGGPFKCATGQGRHRKHFISIELERFRSRFNQIDYCSRRLTPPLPKFWSIPPPHTPPAICIVKRKHCCICVLWMSTPSLPSIHSNLFVSGEHFTFELLQLVLSVELQKLYKGASKIPFLHLFVSLYRTSLQMGLSSRTHHQLSCYHLRSDCSAMWSLQQFQQAIWTMNHIKSTLPLPFQVVHPAMDIDIRMPLTLPLLPQLQTRIRDQTWAARTLRATMGKVNAALLHTKAHSEVNGEKMFHQKNLLLRNEHGKFFWHLNKLARYAAFFWSWTSSDLWTAMCAFADSNLPSTPLPFLRSTNVGPALNQRRILLRQPHVHSRLPKSTMSMPRPSAIYGTARPGSKLLEPCGPTRWNGPLLTSFPGRPSSLL